MKVERMPGPWKYYWKQQNGETDCGVVSEAIEGHGYSICRAPRYETKDQWEVHAKLISAAPDLAEALADCIEPLRLYAAYGWPDRNNVIAKALAALKKAGVEL